ncbi:MAG: glycosyltransferase family 4 protein [Acidimicrobiaceae bacterium]|nr:glycosyltransferase family 4 protein [Acidimicrobiaceae bacterium]
MRVGLVCPYSLSLPGGVQGQVLGLAQALRRQGVEARVLGPCDGPPPDASVTALGNSFGYAANGSMAAIAPDLAAALRTIRALRDERFDVVHLHEPLVPAVALTALVFYDGPMVGTFHRAGESPAYQVTRPFVRWAAGRLSLRVAVSEEAMHTATEALGGTYEVLWNGIDLRRFEAARPSARSGPTVVFVGRHEPRKGLPVLIQAFERLGPEARLWILSEGPETGRLRQRTLGDPRIEWLGIVPEHEKLSRLAGADVLCAPSLGGESFGVVLLEAMAAGAAVVASDIPGYRHVVRAGTDALLVPPGDVEALASALGRLLVGGEETRRLVAAGRVRAADFALDRLAGLYLERYESLLDASPVPEPH